MRGQRNKTCLIVTTGGKCPSKTFTSIRCVPILRSGFAHEGHRRNPHPVASRRSRSLAPGCATAGQRTSRTGARTRWAAQPKHCAPSAARNPKRIAKSEEALQAVERAAHRQAAPFRIEEKKRVLTPRPPGRKHGHPGAFYRSGSLCLSSLRWQTFYRSDPDRTDNRRHFAGPLSRDMADHL
jgi:hypothetical protein